MTKPRARDLGIPFEGRTGKYNAITDVQGVTVGYATVIEGESARTGVTISLVSLQRQRRNDRLRLGRRGWLSRRSNWYYEYT